MLDVQIRKRLATGRKSGDSFSLDVSLSCATRRLVLFGQDAYPPVAGGAGPA